MLAPEVEARLYPYIGYKCKELGYRLRAVGGTGDHLHVLVSLTPTHLVADAAKNLKGASSHYINKESGLNAMLYWQDGYGVVTLRQSEIPKVVRYIQCQKVYFVGTLLERERSSPVQLGQVGAAAAYREDDDRMRLTRKPSGAKATRQERLFT